jgi:thioredoxin 1
MIQVKKFSAPWCGPCKALAPEFKKIKEMFPDVKFVDVDVETDDNIVSLYNVRTVPTVIIEKDNEIVERLTGLHAKQKYIDVISALREST